ncbi:ibr domain containing protein [Stylonychia lemnae]|uniref:RBR-type E3 ubiquitin transferase n=1 Tax=Stylonychia lemnae TaxID=5949 RepID=A0A078AUR2_STYLE|nr:ibr domain containing protein [Stylonychia lemnae]|eukprot:CDW86140.1 ibr domain containing protein [Stylonychia lemnae]
MAGDISKIEEASHQLKAANTMNNIQIQQPQYQQESYPMNCSMQFDQFNRSQMLNENQILTNQEPPNVQDLRVLFEDTTEVLSQFQVFMIGLLVGRSHAQINIEQATRLLLDLNKVSDSDKKSQIEQEILLDTGFMDIDAINQQIAQTLSEQNQTPNQLEYQQQEKLIKKELSSLDPKIYEYIGGDSDCFYKQEYDRSEFARNHLETLLMQEKQRMNEVQQQFQQPQILPVVFPLPDQVLEQNQAFVQLEEEKKQQISDIEIAKKLEEEFKKEAEAYENQARQNQNQELNQDVCQICYLPYVDQSYNNKPEYELVSLKKCQHLFHQECVAQYLHQVKLTSEIPIFQCPYSKCEQEIIKEDVEKYLNKIQNDPNISFGCCPTVGCPFVIKIPKVNRNQAWNPKFECPVCEAVYCLKCKKDFHFGKECDQMNIGNPFKDVNVQQKKCPKCNYWVKRHSKFIQIMHCRCGTSFCFYCGNKKCKCAKLLKKNPNHYYAMDHDLQAVGVYNNNRLNPNFGNLEQMRENFRGSVYKKAKK